MKISDGPIPKTVTMNPTTITTFPTTSTTTQMATTIIQTTISTTISTSTPTTTTTSLTPRLNIKINTTATNNLVEHLSCVVSTKKFEWNIRKIEGHREGSSDISLAYAGLTTGDKRPCEINFHSVDSPKCWFAFGDNVRDTHDFCYLQPDYNYSYKWISMETGNYYNCAVPITEQVRDYMDTWFVGRTMIHATYLIGGISKLEGILYVADTEGPTKITKNVDILCLEPNPGFKN